MNRLHIMLKHIPKDLALVIALTLTCILFVLVPQLAGSPVRVLLGLLLVLFLPGYSLIAALFPRKDDLDSIERIALSFGLSIAVVPLLGLALNYTPLGIRLVPMLLGLSAFTVLLAVIAGVRRVWMPEADRFVVAVGGWGSGWGWGVVMMAGAGAATGAKTMAAEVRAVGWREWGW